MTKLRITSATAKRGVNYVRDIVERANCIFHKIEQENDLGIDGLIELFRNEEPLNKLLALQIKSGESYFNHKSEQCLIPVKEHREYWTKYPLSVYGVVYVPSLNKGYWVDIKNYLRANPDKNVIRFKKTEVNQFDQEHFLSIFMPSDLCEIQDMPFDKALTLFHSSKEDEFFLGLIVLFRKYINHTQVWDEFIDYFCRSKLERVPTILIYYFAHIPWHGDIVGMGEMPTKETKNYVKKRFDKFEKKDILKLLSMVDEDGMISRGTVGQSVEAIVSSLTGCAGLLGSVLDDKVLPLRVREVAATIMAMHWPDEVITRLRELESEGSWYAGELIQYIEEWGALNPYA